MKKFQFILASTSKFRKQLLTNLQLPGGFDIFSPNIDESPKNSTELANPDQLALRLSAEKARAFINSELYRQSENKNFLVIGSDQVAFKKNNGKIYGKPNNVENAKQQLSELSGNEITFLTALSLFDCQENTIQSVEVPTFVKFKTLSKSQIENYLRLEPDAVNCAGSAKSDGLGISLLEYIRGGDDPTALIGLPLIALCELLSSKGIILP